MTSVNIEDNIITTESGELSEKKEGNEGKKNNNIWKELIYVCFIFN